MRQDAASGGRRHRRVSAGEVFEAPFVDEGTGRVETVRLAVTYRCDQRCVMCDLARRLGGDIPDAAVAGAIDRAAHAGARRLILTGGEPALDGRLAAWIRRARDAGIDLVEIQTNAVVLAAPGRAQELADAGLRRALVSLHSADPELSDRITGAPGTHRKTLEGIQRLLAAGTEIHLNCVIGRPILEAEDGAGLSALVRLVHSRWAADHRFGALRFHTIRADVGEPARWRSVVPPLSLVGPPLRAALELARSLGVRFSGLSSAMGVPYCVLGGDPRYLGPLDGPAASRRHRAENELFTRAAACNGCRLLDRCPGVRRDYVALHGEDGLRSLGYSRA